MKKGFTLIELLAVIVILAIIALIATPIVLSIISDSKESAQLRSAEMYLKGLETSVATATLNEKIIENRTYPIMSNGNICIGTITNNTCSEEETLKVEMNGETPKEGSTVTIEEGKIKDINLLYGDKTIIKDSKGNLVYGELGVEEEETPTDHITVDEEGYYRVNGEIVQGASLVKVDGEYYYVGASGKVVKDTVKFIYNKNTNGLLPQGGYIINQDGKIAGRYTGILALDGEDYYLLDGPIMTNDGGKLVKVDEDIYYVTPMGKIKKDFTAYITEAKANGLVEPGDYTFGEDGKLILPVEE